jgi:hypothetical protein
VRAVAPRGARVDVPRSRFALHRTPCVLVNVCRIKLSVARGRRDALDNHRHHHSGSGRPSRFDSLSSAAYFDGFAGEVYRRAEDPMSPEPPAVHARTWLLRIGWRRYGLLSSNDSPA